MTGKNDNDRFGVPDALIREVIEEHRGLIRIGCYVPTRREVATADPALLGPALHDWWWESPTRLIPTDDQVDEVLAILRGRPDAGAEEIQRIIAMAPETPKSKG